MRLSWNEIRARAAGFAREWADETYEKGETQSVYNEFFQIFGVRRRTVARYEEHVRCLDGPKPLDSVCHFRRLRGLSIHRMLTVLLSGFPRKSIRFSTVSRKISILDSSASSALVSW